VLAGFLHRDSELPDPLAGHDHLVVCLPVALAGSGLVLAESHATAE
jgi:hypothetical protein